MRVRQYVYLGLRSDDLDPGAMSERVGLLPDEVKLRGERIPGPPPMPRCHQWKVRSGLPDTTELDEQFAALLVKVDGAAPAIRAACGG